MNMIEKLQELDHIRLNFNSEGLFVLNIVLAFIMFGIALGIEPKNFRTILTSPKPVIIGYISQFVILPFLTFLLVFFLKGYITPSVALGMILVAACPGGNISNFISSLAKANVELSVSLTAIATISAIMFTPFNYAFYGNLFATHSDLIRPIEIDALEMFKTVLLLLGIPVIAGIVFAFKFPGLTKKIARPIRIFSILAFFSFVLLAFANNFSFFIHHIQYIFLLVLLHNGLALLSGYFTSTVFKIKGKDRRAITIETGIQNSGLGLVLIFNPLLFPEHLPIGGMAFVAAWWGIWHMVSGFFIAAIWNYKSKIIL